MVESVILVMELKKIIKNFKKFKKGQNNTYKKAKNV